MKLRNLSRRPNTVLGKVLLTTAAVGVAGSMAGLGTFATFTDDASGGTAIDSGVVSISVPANGPSNRLSVAATDIVPGDTIQRAVDLLVDSTTTSDLSSITLTTTAASSNVLTSDAAHGLQLEVKRCSVPWTEAGTAPAYTYTCSGTESSVLASRAIIGSGVGLSNLALASGSTNNLRVMVTLPTTADDTFQNLSNTVTYTFTGTQRAATDK
jgi:spore coat-associated protein N